MKLQLQKVITCIIFLFLFQYTTLAQTKFSFDISFVRAKFTDTTDKKDLVAIFLLSTPDTANFPPIINMPPKFSILFPDREEKIFLSPEILSLSIDDDRVVLKNIITYELVKDRINLNAKNPIMILTYTIRDISKEDFDKIALSISFSEKYNNLLRYEKRFEIKVEK